MSDKKDDVVEFKTQSDDKNLVLEEIGQLIQKKKNELSSFEDQIRESGEILDSLEELKVIYSCELEKLAKLQASIESLRKENDALKHANSRFKKTKITLKQEIENAELSKNRIKERNYFKHKEFNDLKQEIETVNHDMFMKNENNKKIMNQTVAYNKKLTDVKGDIRSEILKLDTLKKDRGVILAEIDKYIFEKEKYSNDIVLSKKELNSEQKTVDRVKNQIEDKTKEKDLIQNEVQTRQKKLSSMQNDFVAMEQEFGRIIAKVDITKSQLSELENDISERKSGIYQLNKSLEESRFDMKKITDRINEELAKKGRLESENNRLKIVKESYENSIHDVMVSFEKISNDEKVKKIEMESLISKIKDKEREQVVTEERINANSRALKDIAEQREAQLHRLNKMSEEYSKVSNEMERKEAQVESLHVKFRAINKKMMEKEMEFANFTEKVDVEKDTLKKLVGVRKVKEKELETFAEKYSNYEKKFDSLKVNEQNFRVRLNSLDENCKVKESSCDQINDELIRLKKEREIMINEMEASQKRLSEVKREIAMCDSRVKDKSAYLMSQDKEVQRTFRYIHEENIKLERLRDEHNKLIHDKKAYRNENSIIKTNIELAKDEYEKVASEIASLKGNKNKLVAAAFIKEVKDVYYLKKDNDLLKKKIIQLNDSKVKKAVNE